MIFDINLLFWHAVQGTTTYAFTTGEFMSLVNNLSVTSSSTSTVIDLGIQEDMGIGDGEFVPKVRVYTGSTGITSSCSSLVLNLQFQGSTDSTTWTVYDETGWSTTGSWLANTCVYEHDVPRRPANWNGLATALPRYYRMVMQANAAGITGTAWIATVGISTGALLGGIVIQAADSDDTMARYGVGFSVGA